MSKKALLFLGLVAVSAWLYSQGPESFLPAKSGPRAVKLLATIEASSTSLAALREAGRAAQARAEAEAVESYALLAASRASSSAWAKPEGAASSAGAEGAFLAARAAARAAARLLAAGGERPPAEGEASLASSREGAAQALAALILAAGLKEKAALGLEKALASKASGLGRLFPEALELESLLRRAGAAGAREAAAAMAYREPESIASSLLASKARIVSLSPAASGALSALEESLDAYRSWIASAWICAYPGDLGTAAEEERAALSAGLLSVLTLGQERGAALFSAMAAAGGRDGAAAGAGQRLAEIWQRSPAAKRRDLASLCGVHEYTLALFSSMAGRRAGEASSRPSVTDPLGAVAALNGLEIAIADEEALGEAAVRGPEPALLLLERPDLAALAKRETRYAKMYAEASRRLGSLYAQAAEGAQARLESSGIVFKASSRALGSSPIDLVVRSQDLSLPVEESGRRLAFFAVATDSSGASISLAIAAETAGLEYATAFARAAGLGTLKSSGPEPEAAKILLARYGQFVVSAYNPEGADDGLLMDYFPKTPEVSIKTITPHRLGETDLELALLSGWRP
jgi:hypothetical protein